MTQKNIFWIVVALLVIVGSVLYVSLIFLHIDAPASDSVDTSNTATSTATTTITYENREYGFRFTLPATWSGYSVSVDTWTGNAAGDELGDVPFAQGPVISIHHPLWTGGTSRQDIPIMVFTLEEWRSLQEDKFHIGAAPIGPSELARNAEYVFALPARYNFSFPVGYEEVEEILRGHPLTVIVGE